MSKTTSYLKHKIRFCKDPLKKKNLQKVLDYVLKLEEREKPTIINENGIVFAVKKSPHCPNCGQKLDWSDKE